MYNASHTCRPFFAKGRGSIGNSQGPRKFFEIFKGPGKLSMSKITTIYNHESEGRVWVSRLIYTLGDETDKTRFL